MIELRRLSPEDGRDVYEMLQRIPREENGLQNKANGLSWEEFRQWLVKKQEESVQQGIVDGWKVPSTTYWLYADGVPVGFGSVRVLLTEALKRAGGHIGYGIAAPFRGRGYGKELLRLLLSKARDKGIETVLLTIRRDNAASRAVARACGGVLTEETEERAYYRIPVR